MHPMLIIPLYPFIFYKSVFS